MDGQSRQDLAARQYIFGLLEQAGADIYPAGSSSQDVDGILRVVVDGEVRHWDLIVCSAETWTDFPVPVDRLATDRSVLLALNWTTREVLWLAGAPLRHPEPDAARGWQRSIFNKLARPHLEEAGAADLKKLLHFITE